MEEIFLKTVVYILAILAMVLLSGVLILVIFEITETIKKVFKRKS